MRSARLYLRMQCVLLPCANTSLQAVTLADERFSNMHPASCHAIRRRPGRVKVLDWFYCRAIDRRYRWFYHREHREGTGSTGNLFCCSTPAELAVAKSHRQPMERLGWALPPRAPGRHREHREFVLLFNTCSAGCSEVAPPANGATQTNKKKTRCSRCLPGALGGKTQPIPSIDSHGRKNNRNRSRFAQLQKSTRSSFR